LYSSVVALPGEEWLIKKVGAYLPGVYEEVLETVDAYVLTEKVIFRGNQFFDMKIYNFYKF